MISKQGAASFLQIIVPVPMQTVGRKQVLWSAAYHLISHPSKVKSLSTASYSTVGDSGGYVLALQTCAPYDIHI
jgi:hypothetical protein